MHGDVHPEKEMLTTMGHNLAPREPLPNTERRLVAIGLFTGIVISLGAGLVMRSYPSGKHHKYIHGRVLEEDSSTTSPQEPPGTAPVDDRDYNYAAFMRQSITREEMESLIDYDYSDVSDLTNTQVGDHLYDAYMRYRPIRVEVYARFLALNDSHARQRRPPDERISQLLARWSELQVNAGGGDDSFAQHMSPRLLRSLRWPPEKMAKLLRPCNGLPPETSDRPAVFDLVAGLAVFVSPVPQPPLRSAMAIPYLHHYGYLLAP